MQSNSTAAVLSPAAVPSVEQLLKAVPTKPRRERGEGSIYYDGPKQSWACTLLIKNPRPGQPKRKVFRARGPETGPGAAAAKAAALAKRDRFSDEAQDNKSLLKKGRRQRWTVSAWVDRWLEEVVRPTFDPRTGRKLSGHAATSYTGTEVYVRLYIRDYFQHVDLLDLSTEDIKAWLKALQKQLLGRGLSMIQAVQARKRLVQALNWAISLEPETGLRWNPAEHVDAPEYEAPKVELLGEEQMIRLQVAARTEGIGPMTLLGAAGALRKQELAGAQWGDLHGRILKVQRKVNTLTKKALEGHPAARHDARRKKQRKTATVVQPGVKMGDETSFRLVPLSAAVVEELMAHRQWLSDQARFAGAHWTGPDPLADDAWVFPDVDGNEICPNKLYRRYAKVAKAVGVTTKLHQLRHEALSTAIKRGAPLWKVQQLAGHAQLSTTTDIYGHFQASDLHDVADDLGDYFTRMGRDVAAAL